MYFIPLAMSVKIIADNLQFDRTSETSCSTDHELSIDTCFSMNTKKEAPIVEDSW